MIIAANGDTEIAELLLDHGADPELEDKVHINRIKYPRIAIIHILSCVEWIYSSDSSSPEWTL